MLDLHDEIEKVRVKRDLYFARGENDKALEYEALRNGHIDALQALLALEKMTLCCRLTASQLTARPVWWQPFATPALAKRWKLSFCETASG